MLVRYHFSAFNSYYIFVDINENDVLTRKERKKINQYFKNQVKLDRKCSLKTVLPN